MKKYYNVTFQYSETVYCSNIAHAESVEDVKEAYAKYKWCEVSEARDYDVEDAKRRMKPIVEIEPKQKEEVKEDKEMEKYDYINEMKEDIMDIAEDCIC